MADLRKQALETFLQNDFWREYYEQAPSDACKEYIEWEFTDSLFGDEEAGKQRKALESRLSVKDWEHLLKYCGNNPFRGYIQKKIKELTA